MSQQPPDTGSTEVTTYFKDPKPPARRRQRNSTLPVSAKPIRRTAPKPKPNATGVTWAMRTAVLRRDGARCRAVGVHHPDCPGTLTAGNWVPHHVWPRGMGGPDTVDNLIAVWCPGAMGLNGCHGKVHQLPVDENDPNYRPDLLRREYPIPAAGVVGS